MDMQITITQWNEEYRKLSNLFKNEENNLIKTFLQDDYSLFKVYQNLIKTDFEKEKNNYQIIEKQLKNYINESFSYLKGKNATRINNFDFQNKIRKIDELFHKIKKDQKTKYDNLLIEESTLEKEINNYTKKFEQLFKEMDNEIKTKNISNNNSKILKKQKPDKHNLNLELINKYINNIMNNIGIIDNEINEISLKDLEQIIGKLDSNDIIEIKEIIEKIRNIIDKEFGGVYIGWQPKEHEEFLKLRKSYNNNINNYEFLTDLCNLIPYIPSSEHKNHIRLFEKYIQLKDIITILIKKYTDLKQEIDDEEKTLFFERKNFSKKKIPSDLDNLNLKKKMMIKEWKEKKTMEKKTSLAKQKKDEKLQKEKERNLYLSNKEKNEILINKYKEKKETEKKIYNEKNNDEKYKNIFNKIDFDRIKTRENILLEKKKKALRVQSGKNLRINNNNNIKNKINDSSKRKKSKSRVINANDGINNINRNLCITQEKGRNLNDSNQLIKYKSKDFS